MSHYIMMHTEAHGRVNGIPLRSNLPIPYNINIKTGVRWKYNLPSAGVASQKLIDRQNAHIKKVDEFLTQETRESRFYRVFRDFGASHELAASLVWGDS